MNDTASPVFIARVTDVYFDKKQPLLPETWLELRLFIPGEPPVRKDPLPLQYLLQGDIANSYVHFLVSGIDGTGPEELRRLCLLLLMVRDTFYSGLETFISPANR